MGWKAKEVATDIEVIILQPNTEAAQRRRVIQIELRRWHPDKFTQSFGTRLASDSRDRTLAQVTVVAQSISRLKDLAKAYFHARS